MSGRCYRRKLSSISSCIEWVMLLHLLENLARGIKEPQQLALECLPSQLLPLPRKEGTVFSVSSEPIHHRSMVSSHLKLHHLPIAPLPDLQENRQCHVLLLHFCRKNIFSASLGDTKAVTEIDCPSATLNFSHHHPPLLFSKAAYSLASWQFIRESDCWKGPKRTSSPTLPFTDNEAKTQRGGLASPWSHSKLSVEPQLEPGTADPRLPSPTPSVCFCCRLVSPVWGWTGVSTCICDL